MLHVAHSLYQQQKNAEAYTSDSIVQSRQSQVFIINATSPSSAAKMGLSG